MILRFAAERESTNTLLDHSKPHSAAIHSDRLTLPRIERRVEIERESFLSFQIP
jgi:hypothetical protein